MNFVNEIKAHLTDTPLIQRIKHLEKILDSNPQLKDLVHSLKDAQKKMVNAKEFHQTRQYEVYKSEYDQIYERILDFPFVEEYLSLLEEANDVLLNLTNLIETKINKELEKV